MKDNASSAGAEAEVMELERQRRAALVAGDRPALEALLSEDLLHIHTDGKADTKGYFLDQLGKRVRFLSITPGAEQAIVRDGCVVISAELALVVQAQGMDAPLNMQNRVLSVWAREGDAWRQVAYQATRIP